MNSRSPHGSLHPRLQEIDGFLAERRAEVLTAVTSLPDAERVRTPPGAWSVATIIDHLRLTETSVSRLLHVTVSRLPEDGPKEETETVSVLQRFDHGLLTNRDRRLTAPSIVQPRTDIPLADALAGLDASRTSLQGSMREAAGIALGNFTYPHPFFGQLDLYQWLVFLGLHESRHACQIRELGATRFDP